MRETRRPPVDDGTVLITGASAGIGREFALQLAAPSIGLSSSDCPREDTGDVALIG
jgi:NAD(P)-dependent dehydrogenase (short-subunit alcohol dehydrogenase family)